jgi:hypothetical protein
VETATPSNVSALKKLRDDLAASPHNAPSIAYKIRYSRPASDLQRAALEKGKDVRTLKGCIAQLKELDRKHSVGWASTLEIIMLDIKSKIDTKYLTERSSCNARIRNLRSRIVGRLPHRWVHRLSQPAGRGIREGWRGCHVSGDRGLLHHLDFHRAVYLISGGVEIMNEDEQEDVNGFFLGVKYAIQWLGAACFIAMIVVILLEVWR